MNQSLKVAVRLLNEFLKLDPVATNKLFLERVPCNEKVVNHPTIVVAGGNTVGFIGVLNGMVGDNEHRLAMQLDDNGVIVGFQTVTVKEVSSAK